MHGRIAVFLLILVVASSAGVRGVEPQQEIIHPGAECPDVDAPVCGADGHVYGNACQAGRYGIDVAYEGLCRVASCPDVEDPVCGEDGRDYRNACEAQKAGVRVQHAGTCKATACPCTTFPYAAVTGEPTPTIAQQERWVSRLCMRASVQLKRKYRVTSNA